ncbi:hypothetical protein ACVME8_008783 [Bradyrhizobium diazoefficiens]
MRAPIRFSPSARTAAALASGGTAEAVAHNGLVAGSSPAGPTKNINILLSLRCLHRDDRTRNRTRYVRFSFVRRGTPFTAVIFLAARAKSAKGSISEMDFRI